MIRVSAATAAVLGFGRARLDARPTTAYFMAGENCPRSCAFCPQGRAATGRPDRLSRVTWPAADPDRAAALAAEAWARGELKRACIQTVPGPGWRAAAAGLLDVLRRRADMPVSVCLAPAASRELAGWFDLGADRLGLPLDTARAELHRRLKGRSWERDRGLIAEAAAAFPGRIGTHLIVGLGESEEDAARCLVWCAARGVRVGLFAFTPVRGTPLADRPPPAMGSYRRLQALRYLLETGAVDPEKVRFAGGRLADFGLPAARLRKLLAGGEAFRTSGCPDCNRPFYNERPGGPVYNYPRPPARDEAEAAAALVLGTAAPCGGGSGAQTAVSLRAADDRRE